MLVKGEQPNSVCSQMSNSVNDETSRPPALVEVDLEDLVEEVVKSCWSRGRQRASATGDDARGEVDILLDVRMRHSRALVDVGGLKRVLFNVIGNSLKVRIFLEFADGDSAFAVALLVRS